MYYPNKIWNPIENGEMPLSIFVFRDMDGDGNYTIKDRPFANVVVEVLGPAGPRAALRSNISGFVNCMASAVLKDRLITQPGAWHIRVVPPPGWAITTGNAQQVIVVVAMPGAPGGLVARVLPDPVGLAPIPSIRGRIARPDQAPSAKVLATGPDGNRSSLAVGSGGTFSVPVTQGAWLVDIAEVGARDRRHHVPVDGYPVVLPLLPPDPRRPAAGARRLIDFDDLIAHPAVAKIPNGYGGLNWRNWVVTHNRTYQGEGYINGTVSGDYVAYNGSGHPAVIDSENPFDFIGGYFTVAWSDAEGETLHVRAWRQDALVHEDTLSLSAMGPVFFSAHYQGITRMELRTAHYWQAVADALTFAVPGA
jgi:hypothetical protein